ncbi:D-3-phosphoglycerate dehydrogenase, chloroplastic [Hordeum vulgare]|nr:D-3-phosphoglycerate dehydrogenase, chloroplastic [Hordeum vulgare]
MQFWSFEGAVEAFGDFGWIDHLDSKTLEQGYTRTFACSLLAWDVAHIPTKQTFWVLKRWRPHRCDHQFLTAGPSRASSAWCSTLPPADSH